MSKQLRILIPHDLNNNYLNLVPLINKLQANSAFGEICLFHAYEPPVIRGKNMHETMKDLIKDDEKNIAKILATQAKIFKKLIHPKTVIKTVIKRSAPVVGIKSYAKKYNPDLIMLTTQQHMGISKFINNSNTLKLMNILDAPFLILPKDYKFKKEIRLNFLIEHFENYDLAKKMSKNLTDIFDDVKFLHRDPDNKKESTKDIKVIDSIENYIKKSKHDEAFMLIRKKKNIVQKALTKGFVDRLIGLNKAPVIIINE